MERVGINWPYCPKNAPRLIELLDFSFVNQYFTRLHPEYLEYAGIDIKPLIDEKAIKKEYLRQIYRVDSREKILDSKGKVIGKSSSPRNLH